jgi:hypothetical protein
MPLLKEMGSAEASSVRPWAKMMFIAGPFPTFSRTTFEPVLSLNTKTGILPLRSAAALARKFTRNDKKETASAETASTSEAIDHTSSPGSRLQP